MYRRPKLHLHIGLRIFKTALAVTIAMVVARLVDSYSPIFAGLGAVVAMARTLPESLEAARTQVVALVFGALVAFGILWLDPTPSPLLIGVGVLAVLSVCALCRLYYAVSLAAIIVLSACVSTSGDPMLALLHRLLDTSIGLAAGVAVNTLVKPYNNRPRVTALLQRLAGRVPACLDACVLQDLYPDLTPLETDLRAIDVELDLYRRQHFRRREAHERDTAFLTGLEQLAERMLRELQTLCWRPRLQKPRRTGGTGPGHVPGRPPAFFPGSRRRHQLPSAQSPGGPVLSAGNAGAAAGGVKGAVCRCPK